MRNEHKQLAVWHSTIKSKGDNSGAWVVNVGEGEISQSNAIWYNTNTNYTVASKNPGLNQHLYDSTHNEHYKLDKKVELISVLLH